MISSTPCTTGYERNMPPVDAQAPIEITHFGSGIWSKMRFTAGAILDRKSTRLNSSHLLISYAVFFFNDTATTEIYTLSLHDALPIYQRLGPRRAAGNVDVHRDDLVHALHDRVRAEHAAGGRAGAHRDHPLRLRHLVEDALHGGRHLRSEEHTSELQSPFNLVCRLFF